MADIHGSPALEAQNPQAPGAGSAPVPFRGPLPSEPPQYGVRMPMDDAASVVMAGIPSMPGLTESAAAHDIAAGTADAPYYAGAISPIHTMGDGDADDLDDVSGTVQGAVDSATARWKMHMADAHAGGKIGDLMVFPPEALEAGGVGNVMPTGGFYDPPRDYGDDRSAQ